MAVALFLNETFHSFIIKQSVASILVLITFTEIKGF